MTRPIRPPAAASESDSLNTDTRTEPVLKPRARQHINSSLRRIDIGGRRIDVSFSRESVLAKLRLSLERELRLLQTHFILSDCPPCRFSLRVRQRKRCKRNRVVQAREYLSSLHVMPSSTL